MSKDNEELLKEAIKKAADEAAAKAKEAGETPDETVSSEAEVKEDAQAEAQASEPTEEEKLEALVSERVKDLNDKLLRNLAEFENFRKRNEKEKSQMFEIGAKSIVEKILPTIDNFERGLATVPEDRKDDPFVQGMDKIYKQLIASLEDAGVKTIEAVGKEFDPNLHNAVMHEENEAFGENTVSEELQKGYMYRDTVIRHSMVKVAN